MDGVTACRMCSQEEGKVPQREEFLSLGSVLIKLVRSVRTVRRVFLENVSNGSSSRDVGDNPCLHGAPCFQTGSADQQLRNYKYRFELNVSTSVRLIFLGLGE